MKKYFSNLAQIYFHHGRDLQGLNQDAHYDALVFCGGTATHKIGQVMRSKYGTKFSKITIETYGAINPDRILTTMAENANRLGQY